MEKAPQALCFHTEALSHAMRHGDINENKYQIFVRAHVIEVIEQTFPQFNRHITLTERTAYVDEFIRTHHAIEPEFHHIATEFVRFMQQRQLSQCRLLSLLEYEWVLFSVSLLPDNILLSETATINLMSEQTHFIEINPTLYCLELPFSIEKIENNTLDFTEEKTFFYGVFRHAEHSVLYKPLNEQDRYLIQLLRESRVTTYDILKKQAFPIISVDYLIDWLMQNNLIHFIRIYT